MFDKLKRSSEAFKNECPKSLISRIKGVNTRRNKLVLRKISNFEKFRKSQDVYIAFRKLKEVPQADKISLVGIGV